MKNRIIFPFIILFFVFSFKGFTQKFHGGIAAGLVASQVEGDTYAGYNKAGLFGGGYVSINIGQRSFLQMELTYFQKGSRKNPDTLNYSSYLLRTNYVELPILFQYQINKFTVEAGPSAGFLIGYKEKINEEPAYSDNPLALVTFQINLGIRFNINEHFTADFRLNNSLLNIRKHNVSGDVWHIFDYGQFHNALVLSLFYQLR